MGDVKLPFSDFKDVRKAAQDLLALAGENRDQIRTADDGFVVSEEFARKHGLDADPKKSDSGDSTPTAGSGDLFDPEAHTVAEVMAYLSQATPDERFRVIDAERAGKGRQTILAAG